MNSSTLEQFIWVGQFLGFVPGAKSPYQYLALQLVAADVQSKEVKAAKAVQVKPVNNIQVIDAQATDVHVADIGGSHQVSLSKSLRRMLMGYLSPQDWIRVIGKPKFDAKTGDMQWRAREIVKLSPQQIQQYAAAAIATSSGASSESVSVQPADRPIVRALICQNASCRQRGARAVEAAIAQTLHNHDSSAQLQIQSTGCMKQCKAGPHLVLLAPKPASQHTADKHTAGKMSTGKMQTPQRYTRVTPAVASQIVEQIVERLL